MKDVITIKSGALGEREEMPKLNINELGYRTDEKALYIGTEAKNERLCGVDDIADIKNSINTINDRLGRIEEDAVREISQIKTDILNINTRLDALEKNPSE